MRAAFCTPLLCCQVAQGLVVLEQHGGAGGPKPLGRVNTSLQLAGLDVTRHALLLHDGQTAQVFAISEADSSTSLLSEFAAGSAAPAGAAAAGGGSGSVSGKHGSGLVVSCASSSCCMALFGDSVYRIAELRVEVCNLSGAGMCMHAASAIFALPCSLRVWRARCDHWRCCCLPACPC